LAAFRIVSALGHFLYVHQVVRELLVSLQLDVQLRLIMQNEPSTNPLKSTPEAKPKLQELGQEVLDLLSA